MIDGIAAIVGEDVILYSEINQMAFEMAQQSGIDLYSNEKMFSRFQEDALREMVRSKIILLQAAEDSVVVEDRNIEMSVEQQMQQYINMAGSEEVLEMYLDTPVRKIREQLYERIKSQMLVQKLQTEKFSNISVSRPEVEEFYSQNKDSIPDLPRRVDISHILITEKPSPESYEKTYNRLIEIRKEIKSGKLSFEEAAKKYSQDPGSATEGGDLGMSPKGTFVPEFERAAYELKVDEISLPIKTQFGYHLIQLIEKRGEMIHTRHILLPIQTTENDDNYVINMLSTLRDSLLDGENFQEFALKYSEDPDVKSNKGHLGEFDADNLQIPEFGSVVKKLKPGDISEPFISQYGFHILKLNNRKEAESVCLETHYATIEKMALNQKKSKFWESWMDKLYSKFYVEIKY